MIPNYRKNQLYRGLNFLPEQFIYKDYFNLNSDIFMKNRLNDYYFKKGNIKFLFNMSYPVSGQFPINNLNFLDKHSYGSGIEKINKFSDNKFNYRNTNSFKFDNSAFESQNTPHNNLIPFYLTNRNHKFMKIINSGFFSENSNFSKIVRSGYHNPYSLYGYYNILDMGISDDNTNQFKTTLSKYSYDFESKNNYYLNKKIEAADLLLGNFNNSSPSVFVSDSEAYSVVSKFSFGDKNIKNGLFGDLIKYYDIDYISEKKIKGVFDTVFGLSDLRISNFRLKNYFELYDSLRKKI
jgi:hypothetical protein